MFLPSSSLGMQQGPGGPREVLRRCWAQCAFAQVALQWGPCPHNSASLAALQGATPSSAELGGSSRPPSPLGTSGTSWGLRTFPWSSLSTTALAPQDPSSMLLQALVYAGHICARLPGLGGPCHLITTSLSWLIQPACAWHSFSETCSIGGLPRTLPHPPKFGKTSLPFIPERALLPSFCGEENRLPNVTSECLPVTYR